MANKSARPKKVASSRSKKIVTARGASASKTAAKRQVSTASKGKKGPSRLISPTAFYAKDRGLMTAFHHMQRASVVMSLMDKNSGKDLRGLLERGVKLYRKAMEDEAKEKFVLCAIGVLRAAEHLSIAGLYTARRKHRQRVMSPTPEWLGRVMMETDHRLGEIEDRERGKGADLFPVTVELLRQAKDAEIDAHLAFELTMAADALCFALENGL